VNVAREVPWVEYRKQVIERGNLFSFRFTFFSHFLPRREVEVLHSEGFHTPLE